VSPGGGSHRHGARGRHAFNHDRRVARSGDAKNDAARTTTGRGCHTNSHYRVEANFLRFTDVWETVPLSEAGLLEYLKSHQPALDPIEGIWSGDDQAKSRIGIMRNISRPGRDFVGFILGTKNLSWQNGYKKLDIKQGERRAVYRFDYYLDDFQAKADAMTLGGPAARRFRVHLSHDAEVISFTRE
jgi:hypothetical protein